MDYQMIDWNLTVCAVCILFVGIILGYAAHVAYIGLQRISYGYKTFAEIRAEVERYRTCQMRIDNK